jgi:hypothetical protein
MESEQETMIGENEDLCTLHRASRCLRCGWLGPIGGWPGAYLMKPLHAYSPEQRESLERFFGLVRSRGIVPEYDPRDMEHALR